MNAVGYSLLQLELAMLPGKGQPQLSLWFNRALANSSRRPFWGHLYDGSGRENG